MQNWAETESIYSQHILNAATTIIFVISLYWRLIEQSSVAEVAERRQKPDSLEFQTLPTNVLLSDAIRRQNGKYLNEWREKRFCMCLKHIIAADDTEWKKSCWLF